MHMDLLRTIEYKSLWAFAGFVWPFGYTVYPLSLSVCLSVCPPADDVPPYFKTEPVPSQLHLERNRLVLTCMAEGSWPLEFKWIHNDTEITRFSLEYRLVCAFTRVLIIYCVIPSIDVLIVMFKLNQWCCLCGMSLSFWTHCTAARTSDLKQCFQCVKQWPKKVFGTLELCLQMHQCIYISPKYFKPSGVYYLGKDRTSKPNISNELHS